MPTFDYRFTVPHPIQAVRDFHHSTEILKKLNPPFIITRIHEFGEMREGMEASFTMWFGPIPLRYRVHHVNVSENGFTDVHDESPLDSWVHTHTFRPVDATTTEIHEHIVYKHSTGWRGLLTRLLFNYPGLFALFTYRQLVTRYHLRRSR